MIKHNGWQNIARYLILISFSLAYGNVSVASEDTRELVELPAMMQTHMLTNMRDHLVAISEILHQLSIGEAEAAADIAEQRLGMSSLESHGAEHMARFMPPGMRSAGTSMHRAASRFAVAAEEGDEMLAYRKLAELSSACVACHDAYRIR